MAGTAMTPATSVAFTGQLPISGDKVTAATSLNSCRVTIVAERLASLFGSGQAGDPKEFFHLCLALSRSIDHAIGNNQAPETTINIPLLLKQICQHRKDAFLHAALMVLMISVKNACNIGWFSEKEKEELLTLANELGSSFCSPRDLNVEENHSHDTISTIMTRFYPLMKMGHILVSLEVKPGYDAHVTDFSISRHTKHSPGEKIRLFVAQKDEIETSKCIISPQLVNFLLNGKAVEKRTNVSMEPGPQMPTNVTSMLKYGTNLLQAVGQFEGHYIILVAYMSVTSSPGTPVLQDYIHPDVASHYPDSDIIEGASRISLNCPISHKRIKTPVRGLSCKHFQCFDFSNFVDINSRRPSWRCPHCNQSVCYPDIRIDQNMAKILKEVGENVNDVIISADGSWKVMETGDHVDQAHTIEKEQQEPIVLDDYEMANADIIEIEDIKPSQTNLNPQSVTPNPNMQQPEVNNSNGASQNLAAEVDDDFWSGLDLPHISSGTSQAFPANSFSTPPVSVRNANLSTNEYGAFIPGYVPNLQQRSRVSNFPAANSLYISPQTALPRVATANEWRQHLARSHLNVQNRGNQERPFVPGQPGELYGQQPGFPDQEHPLVPGQQTSFPGQQTEFPGLQRLFHPGEQTGYPGQLHGAHRPNPSLLTNFQNPHLQQAFNPRMPLQFTHQSHNLHQGGASTANAQYTEAAMRVAMQMTRQPQTTPVHIQTPTDGFRTPQTVSRTDDLVSTGQDQNWRPTGRMRGSLQGSAYTAAYSQFMMQNISSAQAMRPSNPTPPPPGFPDLSSERSQGMH